MGLARKSVCVCVFFSIYSVAQNAVVTNSACTLRKTLWIQKEVETGYEFNNRSVRQTSVLTDSPSDFNSIVVNIILKG